MKVVIVNEGLGYPPRAGNWIRTLNLMLPLADRHEITYVCRGAEDAQAVERAREFYRDHRITPVITTDYMSTKKGALFYARLAANLLSPLPYAIAAHNSPDVRRELHRIADTQSIDVWQFETPAYADALRGRSASTIVVAHNVESLIWQRLYEIEKQPLKRWYIRQQWKKFERVEQRVLTEATRVVAVSPEDAALVQSRFGVRDVAVVDNGVDVAYFAAARDRAAADPKQILFLGSLDWRPNLDSLDLLLKKIFPAVVAQEPEARMCIVGRNPPAALRREVANHARVELHADVPDVRPYLSRSGVMAVPLRIGGGSRLKIVEAIAGGVPVVSSRVGCEGLAFEPGRQILVADTVEGMVTTLLRCMREPAWAAGIAENGFELISQRYDWRKLAAHLEEIWSEAAGKRSPARNPVSAPG